MNNEEIEKMYEKGIVSLSKILEPLIEKFIQDKNSVDIQQCQLIIHYLIEERKFDENYADELEKEIEEYEKQLDLDYVEDNYIKKEKIKEKIKELEEEYQQFADWDRDDDCMITREIIEILEDLLEEE